MKRWYNRKPETMQDWLLLFAVAAALLAAVWYLPAIAAALRVLLGLATPFAGGLALAYVLDIPARWFAIHLIGGRRGSFRQGGWVGCRRFRGTLRSLRGRPAQRGSGQPVPGQRQQTARYEQHGTEQKKGAFHHRTPPGQAVSFRPV